jgi:hypothetical protein
VTGPHAGQSTLLSLIFWLYQAICVVASKYLRTQPQRAILTKLS